MKEIIYKIILVMTNYFFDDKTFKTKKMVDLYIREKKNEIIDIYGLQKNIYPDSPHFVFLMEIVNNHNNKTEKIGEGIEYFYFGKDLYNNNQLRIKQISGVDVPISCVYSKTILPDKNPKAILSDVMRFVVKDQIDKYRLHRPFLSCVKCNCSVNCEIDHIIPFSKLRDDFLITRADTPIKFNKTITGFNVFFYEDEKFKDDWIEYHKNCALYQILCRSCNIKKSNNI